MKFFLKKHIFSIPFHFSRSKSSRIVKFRFLKKAIQNWPISDFLSKSQINCEILPNLRQDWKAFTLPRLLIQSNLVIRNVLIRNKLVLRNHFPWPIVNLLHKDKEHLALRNNFRVTKKFLITKIDLHKESLTGV